MALLAVVIACLICGAAIAQNNSVFISKYSTVLGKYNPFVFVVLISLTGRKCRISDPGDLHVSTLRPLGCDGYALVTEVSAGVYNYSYNCDFPSCTTCQDSVILTGMNVFKITYHCFRGRVW